MNTTDDPTRFDNVLAEYLSQLDRGEHPDRTEAIKDWLRSRGRRSAS